MLETIRKKNNILFGATPGSAWGLLMPLCSEINLIHGCLGDHMLCQ